MSAPRILATGRCLPARVVTNEELSERVDTNDEWVFSRTGIHRRHFCTGEAGPLAQQKELDGINKYREKTGAEPLVFDPEMAAFANYRSWMNQEKEYIGHAWVEAPGNDDIIDLYFNTTSADLISENTLETSMLAVKAWCDVYADSKLHYEAMIDDNYKYVGSSNLYIDDVAIRTHKNRGVQFDIFAGSLASQSVKLKKCPGPDDAED